MKFYSMEMFEIMGGWMDEVAEWQAFEADMATDPYGDADWADRQG